MRQFLNLSGELIQSDFKIEKQGLQVSPLKTESPQNMEMDGYEIRMKNRRRRAQFSEQLLPGNILR